MNGTEIILERDTANDESALVAAVFVQSGTAVAKDELVFEIENSKATEEYYAPSAGILVHDLTVGQTVNFGVAIARVVSPGSYEAVPAAIAPVTQIAPVATEKFAVSTVARTPAAETKPSMPRFSHAAQMLLQEHGIDSSRFDADFVTAEDVQAHVDCLQEIVAGVESQMHRASYGATGNAAPAMAPPASVEALRRPAVAGIAVGPRKRAEIQTLSQGAGATMLSVLGVTLGPMLVRREPDDFLAGRITDLVIYEAARLMRKYPKLNAFYSEGQVVLHEAIHAGLAIDDGGRLMVYGLEHADRTGVRQLAEAIGDAVARYVNNELTGAELTRATFTVTDLSDGELDFVLPLLPQGQSCILGITLSAVTGFRLFAGFDHRVTEGREVTAFLGELRDRLLSFSSAGRHVVSAAVCEYCGRSVSEAVSACREKGLLKVVGRNGQETLCCGSCWNGW